MEVFVVWGRVVGILAVGRMALEGGDFAVGVDIVAVACR